MCLSSTLLHQWPWQMHQWNSVHSRFSQMFTTVMHSLSLTQTLLKAMSHHLAQLQECKHSQSQITRWVIATVFNAGNTHKSHHGHIHLLWITSIKDLIQWLLLPFTNLPAPSNPLAPADTAILKVSESLFRLPSRLFSLLEDEPETYTGLLLKVSVQSSCCHSLLIVAFRSTKSVPFPNWSRHTCLYGFQSDARSNLLYLCATRTVRWLECHGLSLQWWDWEHYHHRSCHRSWYWSDQDWCTRTEWTCR